MSKRPLKPLGLGGSANKLAKLEVTISERNFPLSQNLQQRSAPNDAAGADEWGDVDDDLLLQASQACEQVDQHNQSTLPDYTAWMQPPSTSTQLQTQPNPFSYGQNLPSTSKATVTPNPQRSDIGSRDYKKADAPSSNISSQRESFQFKRPTGGVSGMKEKSNGIATSLAGISGSIGDNDIKDLFVLDNLKEDSEHLYKKLVQMQEENAKLKSENGKLLEQALSKDGEVTILRGRLRSGAAAADGARLERLRDAERLQAEWAERLQVASKQLGSLRTQLDCKELEVVRVKERCRLLESSKVKLSQAMPPPHNHRAQLSQRHNSSFSIEREMNGARVPAPVRRALASASAQTQRSALLPLRAVHRPPANALSDVLPPLLERAEREDGAGAGAALHAALAALVAPGCGAEEAALSHQRVVTVVRASLADVQRSLRGERATPAERRERDERRMRAAPACARVRARRLLAAGAIFPGERAVEARRGVAALAALCASAAPSSPHTAPAPLDAAFVALVEDIATRVGDMSYGVEYSGLLLACLRLSGAMPRGAALSLARRAVLAAPAAGVARAALRALRALSASGVRLDGLCADSAAGNLKFDYDRGLVMFKEESCFLQVFLNHLEACLKCLEREGRAGDVVSLAQSLLSLYRNADSLGVRWTQFTSESRCKCSRRLAQVLVYTLQACARMLKDGIIDQPKGSSPREELLTVCRCGVAALYLWTLRDAELRPLLAHYEGAHRAFLDLCDGMRAHLVTHEIHGSSPREELLTVCRCGVAALYLWTLRDAELRPLLAHYEGAHRAFLDLCDGMRAHLVTHEIHGNVLTELVGQPSSEDAESPAAPLRDVWTDSFSRFHITD